MEGYIYKYIQNNEIVYIGQTIDLSYRIKTHLKEKTLGTQNIDRIEYFECSNKVIMNAYEFLLIKKYRPKYNIQYNNDNETMGLIIKEEPVWKVFKEDEQTNLIKTKEKKFLSLEEIKERQRIGIEKAKREGKFRGRQVKAIDKNKYFELKNDYKTRKITKVLFAKELGVSRPTLDKILQNENLYIKDMIGDKNEQ